MTVNGIWLGIRWDSKVWLYDFWFVKHLTDAGPKLVAEFDEEIRIGFREISNSSILISSTWLRPKRRIAEV